MNDLRNRPFISLLAFNGPAATMGLKGFVDTYQKLTLEVAEWLLNLLFLFVLIVSP